MPLRITLLLALLPGLAWAELILQTDDQGRSTPRQLAAAGLFQAWDANQDQRLTAQEFHADPYLFLDFDADADLLLTEDEFHRALFRYADRNGDGLLDEEERETLRSWFTAPIKRP